MRNIISARNFSKEVYKDPRAVFIEQASYGVPVRMALLEYIFEQEV